MKNNHLYGVEHKDSLLCTVGRDGPSCYIVENAVKVLGDHHKVAQELNISGSALTQALHYAQQWPHKPTEEELDLMEHAAVMLFEEEPKTKQDRIMKIEKEPPAIPKKAYILLAVYSDSRNKQYGIAALERIGLTGKSWRILFTMAGRGSHTDGIRKAVEFLEWGDNYGAIVTSEWRSPLDETAEELLDHENVQGHLEFPIMKIAPVDPIVEQVYWMAIAAHTTVFPDHDFVKKHGILIPQTTDEKAKT
jgi:hypothetical protein